MAWPKLISTKQNLMCAYICVYVQGCLSLAAELSQVTHTHAQPHTGRLKAITKNFQRNPQQVEIKCICST